MKGSHRVVVETARLKYEFTIRRNLTVLQGDSATGKTTLVDLLQDYAKGEAATSVRVESDVPCIVFGGQEADWKLLLSSYSRSLIFIDEGYAFIRTKEFADAIRHADNYFILITREALPNLPYSIQEIYGIRTTGKYHFPQKIYHEFYPLYEDESFPELNDTEMTFIVSEDEMSGYLFLRSCCGGSDHCVSAHGNANIYKVLRDLPKGGRIAVVADGAAFGACIEKVLSLIRYRNDTMLYLPESFEWIVLKSGVVRGEELKEILEAPERFIDSRTSFSWEQFFTDYLEQITADDPVIRYQKSQLPAYYTAGKNRERILDVFPEAVRACIRHILEAAL
ncbi:MAG: translation initiation factor 2 [Lachnospiraceae bacterium]|nr:translation initiation factor 2 [Lachnospiraceae bacterium]